MEDPSVQNTNNQTPNFKNYTIQNPMQQAMNPQLQHLPTYSQLRINNQQQQSIV